MTRTKSIFMHYFSDLFFSQFFFRKKVDFLFRKEILTKIRDIAHYYCKYIHRIKLFFLCWQSPLAKYNRDACDHVSLCLSSLDLDHFQTRGWEATSAPNIPLKLLETWPKPLKSQRVKLAACVSMCANYQFKDPHRGHLGRFRHHFGGNLEV